jgi:NAD(P)-dependent dehydrogenase (short-subunit alcohol dehydrogenase family)
MHREGARLAPVEPAWRRAGTGVCAVSKAALRSLVRTAASELANRQIRVNSLDLGAIDVSGPAYMPDDEMTERMRRLADAALMKRLGKPEEIASVVAFLASDDASYIIGNRSPSMAVCHSGLLPTTVTLPYTSHIGRFTHEYSTS